VLVPGDRRRTRRNGRRPTTTLEEEKTTPAFSSTISICHRELDSREFSVERGGLMVTVNADWTPFPGTEPESEPPTSDYSLKLTERDVFFDDEVSTSKIPVGQDIGMRWRQLEDDDDYFLTISVPDHDPRWCLKGTISVPTFEAPRQIYTEPMLA
jgi:hypothetical protein